MMIVIKSNRTIEPFGIRLSKESDLMLMAPFESNDEATDCGDGDIEFDPTIKNVDYMLTGVIEHKNPLIKQQDIDFVKAKMLECMNMQELMYEIDNSKFTYARVTGKPDFKTNFSFTKVTFNLRLNPFWYGTTEKSLVGSGVLNNEGTWETGLIIEIAGACSNPIVTIGDIEIEYYGNLTAGQLLIIDTERQTVKIGNSNAMIDFDGVFPLLSPGLINVIASNNVTIKYRDKFI